MNGFFGPTENGPPGPPGPRGPKGDRGSLTPIRDKLSMNNFRIVNVKDPTSGQDAVTKKYMDQHTLLKHDGGLQAVDHELSLAPMRLLWSGIAVEGSITLKESPEHFRMIHITSHYEMGRIITANFCPAAVGLKIESWYINVSGRQGLTFSGEGHTHVKIYDYGKLHFSLDNVYGQL